MCMTSTLKHESHPSQGLSRIVYIGSTAETVKWVTLSIGMKSKGTTRKLNKRVYGDLHIQLNVEVTIYMFISCSFQFWLPPEMPIVLPLLIIRECGVHQTRLSVSGFNWSGFIHTFDEVKWFLNTMIMSHSIIILYFLSYTKVNCCVHA